MMDEFVDHHAQARLILVRNSLICVTLLAAIGLGDWLTGWQSSALLLYLMPTAIATWTAGLGIGILVAALSSATRLIINLSSVLPLSTIGWNAGMLFGVLIAFAIVLDQLHLLSSDFPIRRLLSRIFVAGIGSAVACGLAGFWFQTNYPVVAEVPGSQDPQVPVTTLAAPKPKLPPSESPTVLLGQIAEEYAQLIKLSRPVLLGSRDPKGKSCVEPSNTGAIQGQLPPEMGDPDGGPGTVLNMLVCVDRGSSKSPLLDYQWHQARLKTYLENSSAINQLVLETSLHFEVATRSLAEQLAAVQELPPDFAPLDLMESEDWPGYCLRKLNNALRERRLPEAQRWSKELAAAAFSLADLHRWLDFLTKNYLAALDFQKDCESFFVAQDSGYPKYDIYSSIGAFPGGLVTLHGGSNFLEIERRAERFYYMPLDRWEELRTDANLTPQSVWMSPGVRAAYRRLEDSLSATNRRTLQVAVRTPYEHSYLTNMLYRANEAGALNSLLEAAQAFDGRHPNATVGELMSVLMYRGHSFAGLEWADRYQPELKAATQQMPEADADALLAAGRWANQFFRDHTEYAVSLTLRDALKSHRLDCNRATDLIGALYRNSGHARFGHVRWCGGTKGHSVAAFLGTPEQNHQVLLVDGLMPQEAPEQWPQAYFHSHDWPAGMDETPPPYCAELYVRGLDNYIWAEGYIIRGPNAGTLARAAIPYSTHRQNSSRQKVFDGPYPE